MNASDDVNSGQADLTRQLGAIAEHAVGQTREARVPTGESVAAVRARRPIFVGAFAGVLALAVGIAVVVVSNGDDAGPKITAGASTTDSAPDTNGSPVGGNITVLESSEHGPQLCGAVEESYPPQCGGPDVIGWDWAAVDGEESASGTTWGTFYVAGVWSEGRLTLDRLPTAPVPVPQRPEPDYTTPCEALRDGQRADPVELDRGGALESDPEFAGSWWDEVNGVMNFGFTANVEQHRAELVGSAQADNVCVVEMPTSQADLLAAQARFASVSSRPLGVEVYGSGIQLDGDESGAPRFVLAFDAMVSDATTTEWIASFVDGVPYRVSGLLQPVGAATTNG